MPQMSLLPWLWLFILFIMIFMLFNILNYFLYMNKNNSLSTEKTHNNKFILFFWPIN